MTGIPPPPTVIGMNPFSIAASTASISTISRGSGEGTTFLHISFPLSSFLYNFMTQLSFLILSSASSFVYEGPIYFVGF